MSESITCTVYEMHIICIFFGTKWNQQVHKVDKSLPPYCYYIGIQSKRHIGMSYKNPTPLYVDDVCMLFLFGICKLDPVFINFYLFCTKAEHLATTHLVTGFQY